MNKTEKVQSKTTRQVCDRENFKNSQNEFFDIKKMFDQVKGLHASRVEPGG